MFIPGDTMMDMRPPASHGIRSIVDGCTLADRSSAAIRQLFGVQDESLFYGSRIAVNYASFAYNAGQTTVGLLALLAGLTGGTASTGISASGVGALIGVPGFALSMGLALAGAYEAGVGINSAVAMAGILGDNIQRRDALRSTANCGEGSGNAGSNSNTGTERRWLPGEPRPRGWRLPKNGTWEGEPGHSNFIPNDPAALGVAPDAKIPFVEGKPVFTQWKQDIPGHPGSSSFKVPGMTGVHDADMPLIHKRMHELFPSKFENQTAAKNWLSENGITPHHAGGIEIELVPTRLHGGIRHMGGAHGLR